MTVKKNLRCPGCQRWMGEVRRAAELEIRLKCASCGRMWLWFNEATALKFTEVPPEDARGDVSTTGQRKK